MTLSAKVTLKIERDVELHRIKEADSDISACVAQTITITRALTKGVYSPSWGVIVSRGQNGGLNRGVIQPFISC